MKGADWTFKETLGATCGYVPDRITLPEPKNKQQHYYCSAIQRGFFPGDFQIGDEGVVRWRFNCDMVGPDVAIKKGPGELCGRFCLDNP